jgi:hypothetical protein
MVVLLFEDQIKISPVLILAQGLYEADTGA